MKYVSHNRTVNLLVVEQLSIVSPAPLWTITYTYYGYPLDDVWRLQSCIDLREIYATVQ